MNAKKLLIIDDEPLVRRALERAFMREGFEIRQAEDGLSGLKVWREFIPDVVLLDVLMPGLSGPQLLEKLSFDERAKAKVILMSAFTGEWSEDKTFELGAAGFLPKPFENIFEVVKTVTGVLE